MTPPQILQANEQEFDLVIVGRTNAYPLKTVGSGTLVRADSEIKEPLDLLGRKVALPALVATTTSSRKHG